MMGGTSHQKGGERGLWYEEKCLEDVIASKKKQGIDASFEKKILKSYQNYSEETYQRPVDPM